MKDLERFIIKELLEEAKKKKSKKNLDVTRPGGGKPDGNVTQADILHLRGVKIDEKELEEKKRKKRKKRKTKRKARTKPSDVKLTPGYMANRSAGDQSKLQKLIARFKNAKTEKQKKKAMDARIAFEKGQYKSNKQSVHNYVAESSEFDDFLKEMIDNLDEKKRKKRKKKKKKSSGRKISSKVDKALKKKAKDRNAPVGALKAIYRKGMGAFYSSGSRSGQNPHSWSMARVNSVLKGGKARSVDDAQWKQIQKFRQRKKKK